MDKGILSDFILLLIIITGSLGRCMEPITASSAQSTGLRLPLVSPCCSGGGTPLQMAS